MQKTWVLFLGPEYPLEKEMVTHSSILAWEIPWTEDSWQATVHGVTEEYDLATKQQQQINYISKINILIK